MYSTSLGYVMTWIMSQRILLHPRGAYPPPLSSNLLDDLMVSVEADAKRTSVVVQLPMASPLSSSVGRMSTIRSDGSMKVDSQDQSHTLPHEPVTDIEVFIERSVITESKPTNGEPSNGVTYPAPRSVLDRDPGYHV